MAAEEKPFWEEPWNLEAPAFRIAGSVYYVGNTNVSCHLIDTGDGLILLDTAFAQTTYLLTESIRSLGFDPADVRIITHSHGHVDHCGATRRMQELTGAETALGEQDVPTVENATRHTCAEYLYGINNFEPFNVDRPLKHGDTIELGDTVLHCQHTPGHTPGVITYSFPLQIEGNEYTAGLFGGPGLWTMTDKDTEEQGYPGNRDDFARSLNYLKELEVDVWLGAHPGQNRTFDKYARLKKDAKPNPFIDPDGWKGFILDIEKRFKEMISG